VNKGLYTSGIATQQFRAQVLKTITENAPTSANSNRRKYTKRVTFDGDETLEPTTPVHHEISKETRKSIDLSQWLHDNQGDPALKVSDIYACIVVLN
jgi:hypothetical protein